MALVTLQKMDTRNSREIYQGVNTPGSPLIGESGPLSTVSYPLCDTRDQIVGLRECVDLS